MVRRHVLRLEVTPFHNHCLEAVAPSYSVPRGEVAYPEKSLTVVNWVEVVASADGGKRNLHLEAEGDLRGRRSSALEAGPLAVHLLLLGCQTKKL